jgi:hypothetical protein
MQVITVSSGQSILDIALQYYGDVTLAPMVANALGLNMFDNVEGQTIQLPAIEITNNEVKILHEFKKYNVQLASILPA